MTIEICGDYYYYMELGSNFVQALFGSFSISASGSDTRLGNPDMCDLIQRATELANVSFRIISEFYLVLLIDGVTRV